MASALLDNAVLITGAGQRVGLFLAERFLEQGQPVVFTYRTPRDEVEALKKKGAIGYQVDFTDEVSLHAFLNALPKQVGCLRAVIHNASLWMDDADIAMKPAAMTELMAVHVQAPYHITLACRPLLNACQHRSKDIIAISDAKVARGHANYVGYLASKAALENMMLSFAKTFAPDVKVNTVAPGLVMFNEGDSDVYKERRLAESAIPIEPGPEVVWQAVQFLMQSPNSTGSKIELGHLPSP